jgi:hypothetical protein
MKISTALIMLFVYFAAVADAVIIRKGSQLYTSKFTRARQLHGGPKSKEAKEKEMKGKSFKSSQQTGSRATSSPSTVTSIPSPQTPTSDSTPSLSGIKSNVPSYAPTGHDPSVSPTIKPSSTMPIDHILASSSSESSKEKEKRSAARSITTIPAVARRRRSYRNTSIRAPKSYIPVKLPRQISLQD